MNKEWLRRTIRDFEPYSVPEIKERTVLNANESPYNIFDFPEVKEEFLSRLEQTPSCCYPDPCAGELRAALARYAGCRADEILVGNGGDEIIAIIINTFLGETDTLLVHAPTFDVYGINAEIIGAHVVTVPDLPGFRRDREGLLDKVWELQPKLTIICNPNNPTGELLPPEYVEEVLKAAENIVVVDEAYLEFSGQESIISRLSAYDNLIIIRTLSKAFGMAGIRVGYAAAQRGIIGALSMVKPVYNVGSLPQIAALAAMKHSAAILSHNVPPTIDAREYLISELRTIGGVTVYDSVTNFVLVRVPDRQAVLDGLRRAGICVRAYSAPELQQCLRITVTTKDVMQRVAAVIREEVEGRA